MKKKVKLSESLKVLSFLEPGQPIDWERVCYQSKLDKKKVREAIALLEKSAIIAESRKRLKLHAHPIKLNGNQEKIRGKEK